MRTLALLLAFAAGAPAPTQTPAAPSALTYAQALELAMARNLGVEAARRLRAIREAAIRTSGQRPNPSIGFEATRDTPHQTFSFDLPVELGGRRSRRIDLATEELSLADADLQVGLRVMRRELRQAFYSLVGADERVRIAEDVLDISRRLRDAAQARFETGAAPRLEVMQAELGVVRAEAEVELARSTRIGAQASLNAVLNLPPQQPTAVLGTLAAGVPPMNYEMLLAQALSSNADLVTVDRQIAVEQRRVQLLRAERTPTPVFSVHSLFNSPPEFTAGAGVAVSLDVPIFSRNQGPIAESIATTAQLRAKREDTRRTVENSVYAAVARVNAEQRQLDAFTQRLVPTASDLEALAQESYRAGRTSVLGVLDAQRSLRDLRRDALQAALDLQLSLADLEEILGTEIR
jgi:cobalt-zinc-cadmium efflux system outer membrane protein